MKEGKGKKFRVDFSGVEKEIGRKSRRIPEGDYIAKISSVERKKNKAGDAYYFSWKLQVVETPQGNKKQAGATLYYNTSLKPEALFNLRNFIFACTGKNVAGKAVELDPASYVGKKLGITVEDDEYEGKVRSQIADVVPVEALMVDEDADDEDDEDDEDEDEDTDDMDDVDDEDDEEDEEEEKPKKKKGKKKKSDDDDDNL